MWQWCWDSSVLQLSLQGPCREICHWKSHYGFILTKISSAAFTVLVLEITFLKPFPSLKSRYILVLSAWEDVKHILVAILYYAPWPSTILVTFAVYNQWVDRKWTSYAELMHLYKSPVKYFHGWIHSNYKSLTV